jgi:hypothetical protein
MNWGRWRRGLHCQAQVWLRPALVWAGACGLGLGWQRGCPQVFLGLEAGEPAPSSPSVSLI